MGVKIDGTPGRTESAATPTSITHSVTIGSGNDHRVLIALVHIRATGVASISSVTYGGTAMTQIEIAAVQNGTDPSIRVGSAIYYLVDPPVGTADVVASFTGTVNAAAVGAVSLYDAYTTSPIYDSDKSTGASTSPSVTVDGLSGGITIDAVSCYRGIGGTPTLDSDTGQTDFYVDVIGSGGIVYGSSYESDEGVPHTMSWTLSGSTDWAIVSASVRPLPLFGLASAGCGR